MPVCQVCQKDNPTGVEYCEDCGAALSQIGAPTTAQSASASTSAGSAAAPAMPQTPSTPAASSPPAPTGTAPSSPAPEATPPPPASGSEATPADTSLPAAPAAAPSGEQRARLVAVRHGAPTGEEVPLLGQRLVVGRFDPETGPVDVDLSASADAAHISRQHGELSREADGRWVVRDLGSTNGVFVKAGADPAFGPRITAPRPLSNGDEVAFGNARFIFKTE